jgi:hypothetical protein
MRPQAFPEEEEGLILMRLAGARLIYEKGPIAYMRFGLKAAFLTALAIASILPVSAFAASNTYYAKTAIYFNVPSDATFSIAFPVDRAWDAITGTIEGSATTTDWISFNFTSATPTTPAQAQQLGATGASIQSGTAWPIFYIDNTGNVNEKFEVKLDAGPTAGISVWANSTGGTGSIAPLTNISTDYVTVVNSVTPAEYLNLSIYANSSVALTGGQTTVNLFIKATGL